MNWVQIDSVYYNLDNIKRIDVINCGEDYFADEAIDKPWAVRILDNDDSFYETIVTCETEQQAHDIIQNILYKEQK